MNTKIFLILVALFALILVPSAAFAEGGGVTPTVTPIPEITAQQAFLPVQVEPILEVAISGGFSDTWVFAESLTSYQTTLIGWIDQPVTFLAKKSAILTIIDPSGTVLSQNQFMDITPAIAGDSLTLTVDASLLKVGNTISIVSDGDVHLNDGTLIYAPQDYPVVFSHYITDDLTADVNFSSRSEVTALVFDNNGQLITSAPFIDTTPSNAGDPLALTVDKSLLKKGYILVLVSQVTGYTDADVADAILEVLPAAPAGVAAAPTIVVQVISPAAQAVATNSAMPAASAQAQTAATPEPAAQPAQQAQVAPVVQPIGQLAQAQWCVTFMVDTMAADGRSVIGRGTYEVSRWEGSQIFVNFGGRELSFWEGGAELPFPCNEIAAPQPALPVGEGSCFHSVGVTPLGTVPAANNTSVPVWNAQYGITSRTGDEEPDTYTLAPGHNYLVVGTYQGLTGVFLIEMCASTERQVEILDAEITPAEGQLYNVSIDLPLLAGHKAAKKGVSGLPIYWVVLN